MWANPLPREHVRERGRVREGAGREANVPDTPLTYFDFCAASCRIPSG